jgi:hypothetical protein
VSCILLEDGCLESGQTGGSAIERLNRELVETCLEHDQVFEALSGCKSSSGVCDSFKIRSLRRFRNLRVLNRILYKKSRLGISVSPLFALSFSSL